MQAMTSHERVGRIYAHQEADRAPISDHPWPSCLERWEREGMPKGMDFRDFFGIDQMPIFHITDNSPRYPERIVEETDAYITKTTRWGVTMRNWKHASSVPEFLDFTIRSPEAWKTAKARMIPARDRIDWAYLDANYQRLRQGGAWMGIVAWFGFDVLHAWTTGTETVLMAMVEQPEWCVDMFNTFLDVDLALISQVLDAGYHFDELYWYDDMGFKRNQFFSLGMYRELLKPVHQRAIDFAHAKGMKAHLHSCGCVRPFVPDLVEMGVDMLNPLEVKAGMDPKELKREFGKRLAFQGGLNAVLYGEPEAMWAQMRDVVPVMKQGGGYVVSTDHSVPDSVSLKEFGEFVRLAKELGRY